MCFPTEMWARLRAAVFLCAAGAQCCLCCPKELAALIRQENGQVSRGGFHRTRQPSITALARAQGNVSPRHAPSFWFGLRSRALQSEFRAFPTLDRSRVTRAEEPPPASKASRPPLQLGERVSQRRPRPRANLEIAELGNRETGLPVSICRGKGHSKGRQEELGPAGNPSREPRGEEGHFRGQQTSAAGGHAKL